MNKQIEYELGDYVYLKTDREQRVRIVTGISIRPHGITYALACETLETWHYIFEISKDKDILKSFE
jgi:hypothetical protein